MSGKKGIIDEIQLFRMKPFGEWVTVYYQPTKTDEAAILKLLKDNRCPNARLIRPDAHVKNPFVAAGDTLLVEVKGGLKEAATPKGWVMTPLKNDLVAFAIPAKAKQQDYQFKITNKAGKVIQVKATVARQMGIRR